MILQHKITPQAPFVPADLTQLFLVFEKTQESGLAELYIKYLRFDHAVGKALVFDNPTERDDKASEFPYAPCFNWDRLYYTIVPTAEWLEMFLGEDEDLVIDNWGMMATMKRYFVEYYLAGQKGQKTA